MPTKPLHSTAKHNTTQYSSECVWFKHHHSEWEFTNSIGMCPIGCYLYIRTLCICVWVFSLVVVDHFQFISMKSTGSVIFIPSKWKRQPKWCIQLVALFTHSLLTLFNTEHQATWPQLCLVCVLTLGREGATNARLSTPTELFRFVNRSQQWWIFYWSELLCFEYIQ